MESSILPAAANRYQPAVLLIQSITTARETRLRASEPSLLVGQPTVRPSAAPKNMQAINDYYFGSHMTVTEAMTRMVEKTVSYLNDKLDVGSDGDPAAVEAGNDWRDQVLKKDIDVGSEDDFRIAIPGKGGESFQQVARMIETTFNLDALSQDRVLMKELEDLVGFRLDGMSIGDLIEAFADPSSSAAAKVREVISEGLAGQTGSKAMQRLERAGEGPKSVEEAVEAAKANKPEEVDAETIEEDREAIRAAKAHEKLDATLEMNDRLAEAATKAAQAGDKGEAASTDAATDIIAALSALDASADAAPESDSAAVADTDTADEAATEETPAETLTSLRAQVAETVREARTGRGDTLSTLARLYLDVIGTAEDDERGPRLSLAF